MRKVFILTGEPSGDKLASTVISKLKSQNTDIEYLSVGGNHLNKLGILSEDIVKKSFTNWHEKNPIIATDDTSVDYDIFRYRQLSKEDLF